MSKDRGKKLLVVGDRVLIRVEEGEERSKVGLYLPPTAVDNQAVQGGYIIATGPGLPLPDLSQGGRGDHVRNRAIHCGAAKRDPRFGA